MQQTGTEPDEGHHLRLDTVGQGPAGPVVEVRLVLQYGLTVSKLCQYPVGPGTVRLPVTSGDDSPVVSHRDAVEIAGLTDVSLHLL